MITRYLTDSLRYDGTQLRAHWILRTTGICGDALVAWRGPCRVHTDEIADLADVAGPGIAGDDMLHFLWERFDDCDLERAVLRQRLMSAIAREVLVELAPTAPVLRLGDDLHVGPGKLSISIATRSLVSTLIHFAVNVTNSGTSVATAALADLGVEPRDYAERLLARVGAEMESVQTARAKVRGRDEA